MFRSVVGDERACEDKFKDCFKNQIRAEGPVDSCFFQLKQFNISTRRTLVSGARFIGLKTLYKNV